MFMLDASCQRRGAEDQQDIPKNRSGQGGFYDSKKTFVQSEQGYDQLRGIAKGGVEESPNAGAEPFRKMFGGFSHQAGQRNDSQAGTNEQRGVVVPTRPKTQRQRHWNENQ